MKLVKSLKIHKELLRLCQSFGCPQAHGKCQQLDVMARMVLNAS